MLTCETTSTGDDILARGGEKGLVTPLFRLPPPYTQSLTPRVFHPLRLASAPPPARGPVIGQEAKILLCVQDRLGPLAGGLSRLSLQVRVG